MLRSVFIWWKRNDTVFCWMGSMYQLLSVWNVLFHSLPINHHRLRPNDRSWKRVGRGQPFFPLFFLGSCLQIIVPPIVYIVAFFSCCRHPFPFPPSFLLCPSQVVQWRPSSHYWGLIGCVRLCALPHAGAGGDTQRRDGEDSQTSALTPPEAELWLVSVGGKVRVTVF